MKKKINEAHILSELSGSKFFRSPSPKTAIKKPSHSPVSVPSQPTPRKHKPTVKTNATSIDSNIVSNQAVLLANNIAILQKDLEILCRSAYKAQTFRFTPEELKRLRDLSYNLSNMYDRKIGQADLLRLGLLLLEKNLEENKEAINTILKAI